MVYFLAAEMAGRRQRVDFKVELVNYYWVDFDSLDSAELSLDFAELSLDFAELNLDFAELNLDFDFQRSQKVSYYCFVYY